MEINTGDTAWVIAASALVMIMTPGLGFFYGGLVKHNNILITIFYCYITFAIVTILWYLLTFSLVFGQSSGGSGFIGDTTYAALQNVTFEPNSTYGTTVPFILVFFFQLKFATITPALISGAVSTRIKFISYIIFISAWNIVVYSVIGHWVWNVEGWAFKLGAVDFAGGTVVHISSGFSALAAAIATGKRKDTSEYKPCNIPLVLVGNALLWFGWFGFNGGSALAANGLAANACVVTNIAAAMAAITWVALEAIFQKKVSVVGFAIGSVIGLVAITPASGYVNAWGSIIIGAGGPLFVYPIIRLLNRFSFFDDTLDVFCCHGLGGVWGSFATGLLASRDVNILGPDGAFFGGADLLWKQIVVILATAAWSFGISLILLMIIKHTIGLRVSEEVERIGLDNHILNEAAMVFDDDRQGLTMSTGGKERIPLKEATKGKWTAANNDEPVQIQMTEVPKASSVANMP